MQGTRTGPIFWTCVIAVMIWAALPAGLSAGEGIDTLRRSVVRIYTVAQTPDYLAPWAPGRTEEKWGSGFIVAGHRILTNAHVVSNARLITLEKEGDARRYEARVHFIAHDCDLAMLVVLDDSFLKAPPH
jgi:S1-C subfamily serine protease